MIIVACAAMTGRCDEVNEVISKQCGDNIVCNLNTTSGTLFVSGTGNMTNYNSSSGVPWHSNRSLVTNIVVGEGVKSIGSYAFNNHENLLNVSLPNSLEWIEENAFIWCEKLRNISIPSNVRYIGTKSFWDTDLTSINIPASVATIGNAVFGFCRKLGYIEVDKNNANYTSLNGVLYDKGLRYLISFPCNLTNDYTIPDGPYYIRPYAFYGCEKLKTLNIPQSISIFGEHAFNFCYSLSYVNITSSMSRIGVESLRESGIKSITVPPNIQFVEYYSVADCENLESVIVAGNASFGYGAFSYCTSLKRVTYLGNKDPGVYIGKDSFNGCKSLCFVCVPPEYESNAFCGRIDFLKSSSCLQLHNDEHKCFKIVCNGTNLTIAKRENVISWERQTNECIDYYCDNETGLIARNKCNSDTSLCSNGKCVDKTSVSNDKWAVTIEFNVEVSVSVDEVIDVISTETGINLDDVVISTEFDDNGYITRIVVYINDKETADEIAEKVDSSSHEILRHVKNTRVSSNPLQLANSMRINIFISSIILSFLILLSIH